MNLHTASARTDLQRELEELSVQMGIARYREALASEGHTAVPAGMQLAKALMRPMEDAVKEWVKNTGEGLASRSAGLYHFINQIKPEVVAWITGQTVLGMLHEMPPIGRLAPALTLALETAVNYEAIAAENPRLGLKLAKKLQDVHRGRDRAVFIRKGASLVDVKIIQWDEGTRIRLGTLLVQMLSDSTGLVTLDTIPGPRGTIRMVCRPTESCRRWLEESHARCELLSPMRLPMVCRPRDWTNPFNGGYLSHRLRQPLLKTRNRNYLTEMKNYEMPWVYAAVNALQATTWAVNKPIYEVAKHLWEASSTLGGLPSRDLLPLPGKSWTPEVEPDPLVLQAWKVEAVQVHEANGKLQSKRLQVVQKLWVAEQMMERGNQFHYVYNLDWRGRMYPVGPALTPQGDDLAKGMLQFAQGSLLGDEGAYWLAIHGANTFGVDKVSFEERINWVTTNVDMILACGADPLVNRQWTDADSPFCFLAFCMEYLNLQRWVDRGLPEAEFSSSIAVAFDGSCNGLQNFSAMLRDPVGGKATGLIPSEKPADIYTEVSKAAQALIDSIAGDPSDERQPVAQRWVGKMSRKLSKRNTMTVPYGVTRRGMRDQLIQEMRDSKPEHRAVDADFLAAMNYEAIGNVVVAARQAMDWLREAAKVAASAGKPVRWTTPAGLLVLQDYRKDVGDELDFTVLGRRFRVLLQRTGDELAPRKQALGISPNFVHSLDAAHLMRTVLFCMGEGMTEFAMIHDSYGCHAGHAGRLRDALRDAFVEQYSQPVLEAFRAELVEQLPPEVAEQLPPLPPMGTLDLELVKQSEYFFA